MVVSRTQAEFSSIRSQGKRGRLPKRGLWTRPWGGEVAFLCDFLLRSLPFVLLEDDFLIISYVF